MYMKVHVVTICRKWPCKLVTLKLPTESISVNNISHFILCPSLSVCEWQLCFCCRHQLNLAPINNHSGEMEMSSPTGGPAEDERFLNPKFLQCATKKLLRLGFLFDGGSSWGCRFGGRDRRGSHHLIQTVKPATKQCTVKKIPTAWYYYHKTTCFM